MSTLDHILLKCIPVQQPIGAFYIGAMNAKDLVAISWTDVRRIAGGEAATEDGTGDVAPKIGLLQYPEVEIEESDQELFPIEDQSFEQFLGIQRQLNKSRVAEIQQYVSNVDATFPTSVLLAISSDHAHFDEPTSTLSIVQHSKVAKVIDGQHRIAGLDGHMDSPFQVNVAIFIDMDIQDQAMVFATINLKQTKVNKSLAYDLYEFTTSRSPQRTCHDIARLLNYRESSPFKGKLKMLGVGLWPTETITQATFVDRLLRLVSKNPMEDRDLIKRKKRLKMAEHTDANRRIFRNLFIKGHDEIIAGIVWQFFAAVSTIWPNSWHNVEPGNILNRTTGFGALMRFMRVAYVSMEAPDQLVTADRYADLLQEVGLDDGSFSPTTYLPGSSGEKALFDTLVRGSGLARYV